MSDLTNTLEWTDEYESIDDMGAFNHSVIQGNLAHLFKRLGDFTVPVELSLDSSSLDKSRFLVGNEMKPDICIYAKRGLSKPKDILRMTEMPLLVVEFVSPRQALQDILDKFEAYFELGVHSCWLVEPIQEIISVYSSLDEHDVFVQGEVIDKKLQIQLPIAEIFEG